MPVLEYGGITIPVSLVKFSKQQQEPPPRGEGNTRRNNRLGTRQFVINSLEGGLGRHKGNVEEHSTRYSTSDGLWTHQPGELALPPKLTAQATLAAVDVSNYLEEEAIIPVHAQSSVGSLEGPISYLAIGPRMFRVNTGDGSVELAHTFTNNIVWMGDVYANSTLYFAVITDGTTDDARVTSDPTEGTITWSLWFALSSGDRIDWAMSLPDLGGFGVTYMQGKLGNNQGGFYLSQASALETAPSIAVDTETRKQEGTITIANTPTTNPETGWAMAGTGTTYNLNYMSSAASSAARASEVESNWDAWLNSELILASDDSYASSNFEHTFDADSDENVIAVVKGSVAILTDVLVGSGFNFSIIPNASVMTGMVVEIEAAEGNSNDDVIWWKVQPVIGGNLVGENRSDFTEVASTDTYKTFGASDDQWGLDITGADINNGQFGIGVQFRSNNNENSTGDSGSVRVDHIRVTIYYRELGIHSFVPLGTKLVGRDPFHNERIWYIRPHSDAHDNLFIARDLFYADVEYDPEQERLTVSHIPKQIPCFDYVQAACLVLDSMYVAVSNDALVAQSILSFDLNSLILKDINWSRDQGFTEDWKIVNLFQWGNDFIVNCTDGTNLQDMFYNHNNDTFHFVGPAINTNSTFFPWYSSGPVDSASRYRHSFYSNGDTHLGVFRQYTPDTPYLDPIHSLSNVEKEDGPLSITLPEFGDILGAEESDKMLLTAWCFGDNITSDNTVKLEYSIDGGDTFNTWGTFTDSEQKITLATPISFRTCILRISLDHAVAGQTPNPLPIIIEGVAMWPEQRTWECTINPTDPDFISNFPEGIESLWDELTGLNIVNTLKLGITEVFATWEVLESSFEPTDQPLARPKSVQERARPATIKFNEVVS